MPACSPQRFLANDRNLFRTATLAASSVYPVANQVQSLKNARSGTATVALTGSYTGAEQADIEIEIVDTDVEIPRVSTPTFSGAGSGAIGGIDATGAQQVYTVECADAGTKTAAASIPLEGVTIKAAANGEDGNDIRITVDQSSLVFASTAYSLLADLSAGQGSEDAPLIGQGFDWDAAILDGNGLVPTTAHRVAFGADRSRVYLSFKAFVSGQWTYRLVPALQHDVPSGTPVYFVHGGRTVAVTDGGSTTETYPSIETVYDLLYALRTESALLVVDGVVANDRSPDGQASRELQLRTDAHAEVSYGSGSAYATGFTGVTVDPSAPTQLITATCFAVNSGDHPLARLGSERWQLKGSLSGDLGTIVTGVPYEEPTDLFGLTIPVKHPPGFGTQKGRFGVVAITYGDPVVQAPICPVALTLGPETIDQTITLRYTTKPIGDCSCAGMAVPNLDTACLGNNDEGGGLMAYQQDTVDRLIALRAWYAALADVWTVLAENEMAPGSDTNSAEQADALTSPKDNYRNNSGTASTPYRVLGMAANTKSIKQLVADLETTIAIIDAITPASPPGFREAGMDAWDEAVAKLQDEIGDVDASPPPPFLFNVPSERYSAMMDLALAKAGIPVSGGADASTAMSGDGCWRPNTGAAYWQVTGSERGEYAPAYTNAPYFSARGDPINGVFATKEFAFQINVRCAQDLRDGDTVTLMISESSWGATYQPGDELVLPIVAASPLALTGGRTGNPVQNWSVRGSVSGPLAPYAFNPDAPAPYVSADLEFLLTEGGIPFAKGDRFRFAIEGGHFRWRVDGGAWQDNSPPAAIPLEAMVLIDGLSVTFSAGAAASFVDGDIYRFRALQPWAVSNTQRPTLSRWKFEGSSATYEATFDGVQTLDMFALVHDLPEGATVTLSGGGGALLSEGGLPLLTEEGEPLLTEGDYTWSETITWRAGIAWKSIDRAAAFVRITITDAAGGSVRWPWIGEALTTTLSAEMQLRPEYKITRAADLQGGRYIAKTVSGEILWTESALPEADVVGLLDMIDHVKTNGDEPLIVIPNVTRTDDPAAPAILTRLDTDGFEFSDHMGYAQNVAHERRVSLRMGLAGDWQ